jgi:hypothetical protein
MISAGYSGKSVDVAKLADPQIPLRELVEDP